MSDANMLWNWTSPVWLAAIAAALWYAVVLRTAASGRQQAAWAAGLGLLVAAYVSPIGTLADGYLFSAHMVQHLLLLLLVPLCGLLALPQEKAAAWFNRGWPDRVGRWMALPALGWICGVGAMWLWHVPALCTASTESPWLGSVRDVSFLAAGLLFWWPIFAPVERYRLPPLTGIAYLFSGCLGCTLLGIYISFTTVTVCPAFAGPAERLGILKRLYDAGLTPAADQQLGGLLMWVPPCMLYVGVILGLLSRWYTTLAPPTRRLPEQALELRGESTS